MRKNNRKGFTIVELVIVIAVIGILAGVMIPTISGIVTKAEKSAADSEARNAYNTYIIEDSSAVDADMIIKVEDRYYALENGEFVKDNGEIKDFDEYSDAQDAITADTGYTYAWTTAVEGVNLPTKTATNP